MATWPATLPFFEAEAGFSRTGPEGATQRTQMSAGPAKVRRRTTAAPMRLTGTTPYLSAAQLATFETFFADTLKHGSLTFDAVEPLTGDTRTFRFIGTYGLRSIASFIEVSAELELLV